MSSAASQETAHTALPEIVEQAAVEWLRSELEDPEITGAENFLDIGGHSMTFSKLNIFLGDSFGVQLDSKITYEKSITEAVAEMRPVSESTTN